jgi:hypothetical protein
MLVKIGEVQAKMSADVKKADELNVGLKLSYLIDWRQPGLRPLRTSRKVTQ